MPDVVLFSGETVNRLEIKDYFNDYYYSAVQIYNDFKRYGLPWNVGYMEIPEYLKIIYDLFEEVAGQYRTWKTEQK
jgi:hypothetical protein